MAKRKYKMIISAEEKALMGDLKNLATKFEYFFAGCGDNPNYPAEFALKLSQDMPYRYDLILKILHWAEAYRVGQTHYKIAPVDGYGHKVEIEEEKEK